MSDLRVHIAGQGFEVQRIVAPALDARADRIHLLSEKKGDRAQAYMDRVMTEMRRARVDVIPHYGELWDPNAVVGAIGRIVQEEAGNRLFVNVSTGPKTCGIGGTIASMLWRLQAYYVRIDYDKPAPRGFAGDHPVSGVTRIPTFKLEPPAPDVLALLDTLAARKGAPARKSHVIDGLRKGGHVRGELSAQAEQGQVDRVLKRAADWDFIDSTGSGRQRRLRLNERGEAGLKMFAHASRAPRDER